jgi:hypothetical protein
VRRCSLESQCDASNQPNDLTPEYIERMRTTWDSFDDLIDTKMIHNLVYIRCLKFFTTYLDDPTEQKEELVKNYHKMLTNYRTLIKELQAEVDADDGLRLIAAKFETFCSVDGATAGGNPLESESRSPGPTGSGEEPST